MKRKKPKRARLFAAVEVPGPPCLRCGHDHTRAVGAFWQCPECKIREPRDTSGV